MSAPGRLELEMAQEPVRMKWRAFKEDGGRSTITGKLVIKGLPREELFEILYSMLHDWGSGRVEDDVLIFPDVVLWEVVPFWREKLHNKATLLRGK